jgi:hypothetical protein
MCECFSTGKTVLKKQELLTDELEVTFACDVQSICHTIGYSLIAIVKFTLRV